MRRILLDHAREQKAGKRGGGTVAILNIEDVDLISNEKSDEMIVLDESLERLAKFDKLKSQIVEMRYFGD